MNLRRLKVWRSKPGIVAPSIGWGRRYPIRRDECGRSLRQHAFERFDLGLRPARVARELGAKPATIYRYFEDWKKRDRHFSLTYRAIKVALRDPQGRIKLAHDIASRLDVPVEDVLERMQKPWAAKQLATGEWRRWMPDPEERSGQARLEAAERLVDLYMLSGVPPQRILAALDELLAEVQRETADQEAFDLDDKDGS